MAVRHELSENDLVTGGYVTQVTAVKVKSVELSLSTATEVYWEMAVRLRTFLISAPHRDDQPHVPAALNPGKERPVSTEQVAGWAPNRPAVFAAD